MDIPGWFDALLISVLGAALMALWNSHAARLEKLERDKADKIAVAEQNKNMADAMNVHRAETQANFTRVLNRLDSIADRLPRKNDG
jgi:hypothetical protein